jgi:hypothetical protein
VKRKEEKKTNQQNEQLVNKKKINNFLEQDSSLSSLFFSFSWLHSIAARSASQ